MSYYEEETVVENVDYNDGFEDVRETRDIEEEVVYDNRGDEEVEYVEEDTTVETNAFGGETVETETEVVEERSW
ncbi:hypothetical protein GSI_15180 [Ganoderma sinense ZZ0214-1]|uniref:Uncharacterized protein n=1 Tax=Ganoderma sinense ZZ0214-1 TaxID=1077348 RepID=A0A2G8RLV8_9APHY|nr:hypothetical protein GSI_15180 [Ganoderma sinense ZZ0214-1]